MTTTIYRPTHLYGMPRPDRLYQQFKFRRQPIQIDAGVVRDVLAEYCLQVQGKIHVPGDPGRSNTLIVDTSAGKKLLKQYKATLDPAAILHEHAILLYLASIDFPSPRLLRAANGKTLIQRESKYYAMFDFLEGYFQYHHYCFLPTQKRQFIVASGKTLGVLHTTLQNYTPNGYHPNGFRSVTGERWRELSWYIDKLDWCRRQVPYLEVPDAPVLRRMLEEHANRIEASLYRLNKTLQAAELSRVVIHGDYGPYNLFFKPGAPVIILDFELARLDWRLTDLATGLPSFAQNRMSFSFRKMQWFIKAYREACLTDDNELQLLPTVWQFLTLRRVIICWQRYCQSSNRMWLIEAQTRLDLADWLVHNHTRFLRELLR